VNITGLDLATRLTGVCVGDGASLPDADAWEFGQVGDDIGRLLDLYDKYLNAHIDRYAPVAIIKEGAILVIGKGRPGDRTDNPLVLQKLYSMHGHTEFVCHRRGIQCHDVTLQDIKREVTGNPMAKKPDMVAIARRVGLRLPAKGEEDATDAWGAWLLALRSFHPDASRRWDAAVHNPRGKFTEAPCQTARA
jgi:hypothetical protein